MTSPPVRLPLIERIQPRDMHGWLSTFDPGTVICASMDVDCCVFCAYFTALFGNRHFFVGFRRVEWDDGTAFLPEWAHAFQETLLAMGCDDEHPVYVEQALTALDPLLVTADMEAAYALV